MEHSNAALMRKTDQALLAGDFPAFLGLHTEDVVMHVPGNGPLSGDHYGRDGIAAVFQQDTGMLDAPPQVIPLDNLGSDNHACSLVVQRMQRGGRSYEGLQVIIARVRDGQLAEVWFRPEDKTAFDDFFA
jgi:uncharacterized protein